MLLQRPLQRAYGDRHLIGPSRPIILPRHGSSLKFLFNWKTM